MAMIKHVSSRMKFAKPPAPQKERASMHKRKRSKSVELNKSTEKKVNQ